MNYNAKHHRKLTAWDTQQIFLTFLLRLIIVCFTQTYKRRKLHFCFLRYLPNLFNPEDHATYLYVCNLKQIQKSIPYRAT